MNLVVGATGMVGTEVCRLLIADGKPVRGMVRPTADRTKVATLRHLGVEIVQGDLQNRDSLAAACTGVDAVITTAASTLSRQPHDSVHATDLEGQISLVNSARECSVRHFVYLSVEGQIPADTAFIQAKRAIEAHVRTSSMVYTILRPAPFMEVWLGPVLGFDIAKARVRVYGDGSSKLNWIALRDVARATAMSLDNHAAYNATFELAGPDWLSYDEIVSLCEEMGGRRFDVERVPVEALQAQLTSAKDDYERAFAGLMLYLAIGNCQPVDVRPAQKAFLMHFASVREYIRTMLSLPVAV
jgi:uncharacterized protein YbjT (DUF2867 family)